MSDRRARKGSVLLIHDDSDLLDALTRIFEARGYHVAIAATHYAALSRLCSFREYGAIIAGWEAASGIASAVYRWVLEHRYHLRGQFVFLAELPPEDFDDIVEGRCLLLHPHELAEIVAVSEALVVRYRRRMDTEVPLDAIDWLEEGKPSLLLVEDEPLQLSNMKMLLTEIGFSVVSAESCAEAISELERFDYDVILSDWYMPDGSGGDVYEWLHCNKPYLADRCVFMSSAVPAAELARRAPGRPLVHKGQDSPALVHYLLSIAEQARSCEPRVEW